MDPEEFRAVARAKWEQQAAGWEARRNRMRRDTMPVTRRLLDLLGLQAGETLLEVAGGTGDVGLLAAEQVQPGGRAILTDGAEAMVEATRRAAAEEGAQGVEVRQMEAEWLDLPAASVDAIVCRWGYMLLADPGAGLREARRVLRPGGRIALAVWDTADHNPWLSRIADIMLERGHYVAEPPGAPSPFRLADTAELAELLEDAGFTGVQVDSVDFAWHALSRDDWWEHLVSTSGRLPEALAGLAPAEHTRVRDAFDVAMKPFLRPDGSLRLPARAHVARADA